MFSFSPQFALVRPVHIGVGRTIELLLEVLRVTKWANHPELARGVDVRENLRRGMVRHDTKHDRACDIPGIAETPGSVSHTRPGRS